MIRGSLRFAPLPSPSDDGITPDILTRSNDGPPGRLQLDGKFREVSRELPESSPLNDSANHSTNHSPDHSTARAQLLSLATNISSREVSPPHTDEQSLSRPSFRLHNCAFPTAPQRKSLTRPAVSHALPLSSRVSREVQRRPQNCLRAPDNPKIAGSMCRMKNRILRLPL